MPVSIKKTKKLSMKGGLRWPFGKRRSSKVVKTSTTGKARPLNLETISFNNNGNGTINQSMVSLPDLEQKLINELYAKHLPLEYVKNEMKNVRSEKDVKQLVEKAQMKYNEEFKTFLLNFSNYYNAEYKNIYTDAHTSFMNYVIIPKLGKLNESVKEVPTSIATTFQNTRSRPGRVAPAPPGETQRTVPPVRHVSSSRRSSNNEPIGPHESHA
jgi:hypothetical protein